MIAIIQQFSNNIASSGGGLFCFHAIISFEGFSATVFSNNFADYDGGAISTLPYSNIIFSKNSAVLFNNNNARFGSTVYSNHDCKIMATGNSTVLFNDHLVKWCNNTCLPYRGFGNTDTITIDSNGVVQCNNRKAFICTSRNCYCKVLEDLLDGLASNVIVNITDNVTLSSSIELNGLENISIIGHNNITVICGIDGGGLYLYSCSKIIVESITWIGCGYDLDIIKDHKPVMEFFRSSGITIQNCTFQYSKGQVISLSQIDIYPSICEYQLL